LSWKTKKKAATRSRFGRESDGSAWPHGHGKGLNIQLVSGVAVSGRLVLREYTEQDAQEDEKKVAKFKKK
jgi:hypothetical protein